jgi:putative acetyltransferase
MMRVGRESTVRSNDNRLPEREIRKSAPGDLNAIEVIYRDAFPDEELFPLVKALLEDDDGVLSLVATVGPAVVGHVAFTPCRIAGHFQSVVLLGPLAVAPDQQRKGIGTALIRDGLHRLKDAGTSRVFVLGDPAYYGRHGFAPETQVVPPYPLPEEWRAGWQSIALDETALDGTLEVPAPWRRRALWLP